MHAEPQQQHGWLQKLVGDWTYEGESPMAPAGAPTRFSGTESVRSLGGLWTIGEGRGDMPGGGVMTTVMTLGYDPARGRFVGTFVGSMMPHLWVYDGQLDAGGRVLTLAAEGPSFVAEGRMAMYHDVIELKEDGTRTLTARVQSEDGGWTDMMSMRYRRVAASAGGA